MAPACTGPLGYGRLDLYGSSSSYVASGSGSSGTRYVYLPTTSGTYYLKVTGIGVDYTGTYTVKTAVDNGSLPSQTICFTNPGAKILGAVPFGLAATGGASGNPVTFSSQATGVCTVAGSTTTLVAAGTCTIAADQTGTASYSAATQVTQSFAVNKANQTIGTISFAPNTLAVGGTTTASATASTGLAVAFSSSATPTICSVTGTTVTGSAAGTCTITASQAGNTNYSAAAPVTQSILVTATPAVSLNPTSLTFTNQPVGTTSPPKTVTLTNTGGATLSISGIVRNNNVYGLSHNCASLAANGSCTLNVTYSPTSAVSTLSTITITSNAASSPNTVVLNGNGVPPAAPVCTLTASPTSVPKNGASVLSASCTNSPTAYSWTGGTCAGTTAATCTVNPAATTTYGVTGTNSAGSGAASATVTVRAVDLTPILMLLLD